MRKSSDRQVDVLQTSHLEKYALTEWLELQKQRDAMGYESGNL